jgi:succinate-semialdehyde dehydrogenase/glutarate-semialdehyde dehydrogenase
MLRSVDPNTGRYLESLPEFEPEQVRDALQRAAGGFEAWRSLEIQCRAKYLRRTAELLREDCDGHAQNMALEMGKPIREGRDEIEKSAWVCDFYAEHSARFLTPQPIETDAIASWIQFDPLGPVLAIMPWNFPYWQVMRFAAPALMAGNVALLKHASNVPRCAQAIERVFERAGLPSGVFQNLPLSSSRLNGLVRDPLLRAVTLTGSEWAGQRIAAEAGTAVKKIVLELGGSDPFVVLEDVRIAQVAHEAARARTVNSGQSCIAAKRFLVAESVRSAFVDALQLELEALRIGDPLAENTEVGPLARADLLDALDTQVWNSIRDGARLVTGGARIDRPGFFYAPTLLTEVHPGMSVADEETFGPVAAVMGFEDDDQAVEIANASRYGLGASVWSRDPQRALALAQRLDVGCVSVNEAVRSDPRMPFGGTKHSGFGRELGKQGIRELVNVKSVRIGEAA